MPRPSRLSDQLVSRYFSEGIWQRATLADHWERNAERYAERTAVCDGCRAFSWAEAKAWTDRLALRLVELGLQRDDVLVVQLPNSVELPLVRVACEKAGVLCLPLPRTLRHAEMRYCLGFTEAAAVVVPWRYHDFDYIAMIRELQRELPRLRHIIVAGKEAPAGLLSLDDLASGAAAESLAPLQGQSYRPEEVSLINATTGSTGLPKFAEYNAAARLLYGKSYVDVLGLGETDILAALSPAAGGPNIPVYFAAPQAGATAVFLTHFEPEAACKLIEERKVTVACLVPAQLALLVRHFAGRRDDLSSIRVWLSVGAPLASNLAREAEETLGGIVLNTYGAVDWGGVVFTSPLDPPRVRHFTVGRPRVDTEVRLVDDEGRPVLPSEVGQLQGRGPCCSSGYYNNPEATRKAWNDDGWFSLGDVGQWDGEGNLRLFGRKDDLIIRGGQNIQPGEIENHLLSHPDIKEAAVVGMPDPVMGQKVCAYVVPRHEQEMTLSQIVSFLRSRRIASYKLPERVETVRTLPMVSDTKIDKKALAADIADKLAKAL